MTKVVSSTYEIDAHYQKDGSRYCKEFHTLDDGRIVTSLYKLTGRNDPDKLLASRATAIDASFAKAAQRAREEEETKAALDVVVDDAVKSGALTYEQAERVKRG